MPASFVVARRGFLGLLRRPLGKVAVIVVAAGTLLGCTPSIGDKCTLSTDCSVQGTRLCDSSQTAGYCTVTGCTSNACPDNSSCVEFAAVEPGCFYDDYRAPSRTGRSMCMKACSSDSDCRQSDGYVCRDPTATPWQAVLLDSSRSKTVCIAAPRSADGGAQASFFDAEAAVCLPNGPTIVVDAAIADSSADVEGGALDAGEAGDASEGNGDATIDVTDGASDMGAVDALDGG